MDDDILDLERLVELYEPLSHSDLVRSIRNRRFDDPKWLYMPVTDRSPWQGDVVPHAELHLTTRDGVPARIEGPAMLLSHGCDTVPEQDPVAVMAPVFELQEFAERVRESPNSESRTANLRANRLSSIFYLPPVLDLPPRYVDFNFACAVSTIRIQELFAGSDPAQRTRFSMGGWWLFTAKLAHHHARKESPEDYPRIF